MVIFVAGRAGYRRETCTRDTALTGSLQEASDLRRPDLAVRARNEFPRQWSMRCGCSESSEGGGSGLA